MPNPAFFETARPARPRPRLLLLSRHFPPSEETGALRWQKLAAVVFARGWDLDVVTLDPVDLPSRDDRRLEELPLGTRVFGVRNPTLLRERATATALRVKQALRRPSNAASASRAATGGERQNSIGRSEARPPFRSLADLRRWHHATSWLAAEEAWAMRAGRVASAVAREHAPIAIVTCGPPHPVHVAGERIARRNGIPFVMDMRDPWSLVERVPEPYGSSVLWSRADRDEARCIAAASLVVVNTEQHRKALQRRYPASSSRVIAVLNGFDDEPVQAPTASETFTIAYAGTIYLDRDPRVLLQAVATVVRDRRLQPGQLRLVFLGDIQAYGGETMEGMAAKAGIAPFVQVLGRMPRREALAELAGADVLVVLPQDSHLAVPSKVYEYMLFPAWILALAAPESSIAEMLSGTRADVVEPQDASALARVLERRFDEKRASGRPAPLAHSVPQLSRKAQGERLIDAIAQLERPR